MYVSYYPTCYSTISILPITMLESKTTFLHIEVSDNVQKGENLSYKKYFVFQVYMYNCLNFAFNFLILQLNNFTEMFETLETYFLLLENWTSDVTPVTCHSKLVKPLDDLLNSIRELYSYAFVSGSQQVVNLRSTQCHSHTDVIKIILDSLHIDWQNSDKLSVFMASFDNYWCLFIKTQLLVLY